MQGVDEAGVSKIVFTGRDVETRRARYYPNNDIAEAVRRYPDRIIGFARIEPLKGEKAINEINW